MEQAASSSWISPSGAVSVTTHAAGEIQACFKFGSLSKASGPLRVGYWARSSCFIQLKANFCRGIPSSCCQRRASPVMRPHSSAAFHRQLCAALPRDVPVPDSSTGFSAALLPVPAEPLAVGSVPSKMFGAAE